MKSKHATIDARVRHAGKAGAHRSRQHDVRKGVRKPKHQQPRHVRWRDEQ